MTTNLHVIVKTYKDIKECICAGYFIGAIDKLKSIGGLPHSLNDKFILLQFRFNWNKDQYELGLMGHNEYEVTLTKLTVLFLSIIHDLEKLNETESEPNNSYEEGVNALFWRQYSKAIKKFNSIEKGDENYLNALLNKGIAEYSKSISKSSFNRIMKYFLEIEISTMQSKKPNMALLKRMLFNRITMFQGLQLNRLAMNDLEKLKIIDPSWAELFSPSLIQV